MVFVVQLIRKRITVAERCFAECVVLAGVEIKERFVSVKKKCICISAALYYLSSAFILIGKYGGLLCTASRHAPKYMFEIYVSIPAYAGCDQCFETVCAFSFRGLAVLLNEIP